MIKIELYGDKLIFIPFNVPSLKNSKIKTSRGIFASATVKKYLQKLGIQRYSSSKKEVKGYVKKDNLFESFRKDFEEGFKDKETPFKVGFHFVRDSKRDFDFNNATQIIQDLLVAHDMIEDDCSRLFLPFPIEINDRYYSIDKENPGVYLVILN